MDHLMIDSAFFLLLSVCHDGREVLSHDRGLCEFVHTNFKLMFFNKVQVVFFVKLKKEIDIS